MRSYLEENLHQKGPVEWLKVKALSSNPSAATNSGPFFPTGAFILSHNKLSYLYAQK
jgi:hypothetical protein